MSDQKHRFILPYKGTVMAFNLTIEEISEYNKLAEANPEKYQGAEGLMDALEIIRTRNGSE